MPAAAEPLLYVSCRMISNVSCQTSTCYTKSRDLLLLRTSLVGMSSTFR